jgi:hypothetical protein
MLHPRGIPSRSRTGPGTMNTVGPELFSCIACEEFSDLLRSVRASIVRVDMQSSIRASDLAPSPLGECIKYMRNVI